MKNYFKDNAIKIGTLLAKIPAVWDGKSAILEMKKCGFIHWKQMEWIGFYFQFLCESFLADYMNIPGPKYGKVEFDAFKDIPWDFKAHAMNTSSHRIIVNDHTATEEAISEYGAVGLILALGKVKYNDEDRNFQKWHQKIKGGESTYEKARKKRGAWSRLRKVSFDLQQISFLKISNKTLLRCGAFQKNFRNSNGSPRKAKVLIDLEKIEDELEHFISF